MQIQHSSPLRVAVIFTPLLVLGLAAPPAQAQTFTGQSVSAFANIFGSGNVSNPTPNPGGGSGGTAAPGFNLTPGAGRILTFSSVSGIISFTPGVSSVPDGLGPDGTPPLNLATNITSYQGISGISLDRGSGFLTGVFLSNSLPADPAPSSLAFTNDGTPGFIDVGFACLSPALNQSFFIGDGLTGNGSGSVQQFVVPDGATRLFLGYADANNYAGAPGQYQDNSGAVTVSFNVAAPVPEASTTVSLGLLLGLGLSSMLIAAKRNKTI